MNASTAHDGAAARDPRPDVAIGRGRPVGSHAERHDHARLRGFRRERARRGGRPCRRECSGPRRRRRRSRPDLPARSRPPRRQSPALNRGRRARAGWTPRCRSRRAAIRSPSACWMLPMMTGPAQFATRRTVCWNIETGPVRRRNCLGRAVCEAATTAFPHPRTSRPDGAVSNSRFVPRQCRGPLFPDLRPGRKAQEKRIGKLLWINGLG